MDASDDANQRRRHAVLGAVQRLIPGIPVQASIAGRIVPTRIDDGALPLETDRRTRDQRCLAPYADGVDRLAGDETVGAVVHHVGLGDDVVQLRAVQTRRDRLEASVGV